MPPRQRDIYLVPIPFSDLSAVKRRPVLVISHDRYNEDHPDCLVMAITSKLNSRHKYSLLFSNEDLSEGLLPRKSQIRADKVYSVHQKILMRRFGTLSELAYTKVTALLQELIATS